MHQRLIRYADAASIYAVIVLFGISAVDYVTIDQTKRVSGLTMLILIAGIVITRMLVRQQRQINALRGRLLGLSSQPLRPVSTAVAAGETNGFQSAEGRSAAADALTSDLPANVLDFQRR